MGMSAYEGESTANRLAECKAEGKDGRVRIKVWVV